MTLRVVIPGVYLHAGLRINATYYMTNNHRVGGDKLCQSQVEDAPSHSKVRSFAVRGHSAPTQRHANEPTMPHPIKKHMQISNTRQPACSTTPPVSVCWDHVDHHPSEAKQQLPTQYATMLELKATQDLYQSTCQIADRHHHSAVAIHRRTATQLTNLGNAQIDKLTA